MAAKFDVDCGNLAITETTVVSGPRQSEEEIHANATRAVKTLFTELLKLPKKAKSGKADEGMFQVTELPIPTAKLPREKAPPKEKPLTAWQKYALKKGIDLKTKKTNKVWNEERQTWEDKWGKRARETERQFDWVREVKHNYTPGEVGGDPFLDDQRAKKQKLEKEAKRAEKNRKREEFQAQSGAEAKHLEHTMRGLATASMGKFDKASAGKKRRQ